MAKYFKTQNGGVAAIDGVPVFLTQAEFEACCCDDECDCSDFEGDSFQIEWPTTWNFTYAQGIFDPTLAAGDYTISAGTYKQTDNTLYDTTIDLFCMGTVEMPMDVSGVFGNLIYEPSSDCWVLYIDTEGTTLIVEYERCGECSPYGVYTKISEGGTVSGDPAPTTITISKEP